MEESKLKETDFYTFCAKCVHGDLNEKFDPCNECLEDGMRPGTSKPTYFKPKDE